MNFQAGSGRGPWIVTNGTVIGPRETIASGAVAGRDGLIEWVGPADQADPGDRQVFHAAGGYICPGFIDIHVHGGGGTDTMHASAEALDTMSQAHACHGTTGFLATTVTARHQQLLNVAAAVRTARREGSGGATVLGLHLEGPYINPSRAGAQDPAAMRDPDLQEMAELWDVLQSDWRLITLAPELPGAMEAVAWLRERGVTVSMGHTDAGYEQALAGIEAGITHATHCFNAMRGLHHRDPGVVGAVLADPRMTTELIADTVHVHPGAMRVVLNAKGMDRVVLVTDCIQAMGQPDGNYHLGDLPVVMEKGTVKLAGQETLAGSVLTMETAVRHAVQTLGVPVAAAVRMASSQPAAVVGLGDVKGVLAPGRDADLVIMDKELRVLLTMVEGRVVYNGTEVGRA